MRPHITIGPWDMPQVNNRNLYLNNGPDAGPKLWREKWALELEEATMKPEIYNSLFVEGARATVNGSGDLMIDRSAGWFIGKTVDVVKRCKSGLILVRCEGRERSLPQRNLDLVSSPKWPYSLSGGRAKA